jgi:hypothetical protein
VTEEQTQVMLIDLCKMNLVSVGHCKVHYNETFQRQTAIVYQKLVWSLSYLQGSVDTPRIGSSVTLGYMYDVVPYGHQVHLTEID